MGKFVVVHELDSCNFCGGEARWDFRTMHGPWAKGCDSCYVIHRASSKQGTGHGQRLFLEGEPLWPEFQPDSEETVRGLKREDALSALADLGIEGDEAERELEDWGFGG